MKKNLPVITLWMIVMMNFFVFSSQAQNRIHSATDLEKMLQLKKYVEAHPLEKGQTNWAVERLNSFKKELEEIESSHTIFPEERNTGHNHIDLVQVNDTCANATLLTEGTSCVTISGSVSGATQSSPPDSCNIYKSTAAYDVWYKFVAASTNPVIAVYGATSFDAVVFLFDSCGGAKLGCSDETLAGELETVTTSGLTIGHTYYIRVFPYQSVSTPPTATAFTICVHHSPPPPANDSCSHAVSLTMAASCVPVTGILLGATDSGIPGCVGTADDDVWYSFMATSSSAGIAVTSPSSFNKVIQVFSTCGGNSLGCGNSSAGSNESLTLTVSAGSTYYVRVYTIDNSVDTANFTICVTDLAVGMQDLADKTGVTALYPNPCSGILNINFESYIQESSIRIYGLAGNLLKEYMVLNKSSATFDMDDLAGGIYFIRIENEKGSGMQKIILTK